MAVGRFTRGNRRATAWRRILAICACLLAVAVLVFGHLEPPSLSMHRGGYVVTSAVAHFDSHRRPVQAPDDHPAASGHCLHHGTCGFYGVVPVVFALVLPVSAIRIFADDQSGSPRVIPPLQHPPNTDRA